MIAWAIALLVKRGWNTWLAKLAVIGGLIGILVLAIVAIVAVIYYQGETAGGAKVAVKVEKAHAKAVADSRKDERKLQTTGAAIGAAVGRSTDATTGLVRTTTSEIHDALASTPAAPVGVASVPVDSRRLSASLDALVDRANRSADAADAQP